MNRKEQATTPKGSIHPNHQKGMEISVEIANNTMKSLRLILTQIEATLGDTKQAESFKKVVKHEFYRLKDFNQHAVYRTLGVETYDIKRTLEPNDEATVPIDEENN